MNKAKREDALDPEAEESIAMITTGLGRYLRLLLLGSLEHEKDARDKGEAHDDRGVLHG